MFRYEEIARKEKKTNINKIKMKFCQVKKIARNLEKKNTKRKKLVKKRKLFFKVDVDFFAT